MDPKRKREIMDRVEQRVQAIRSDLWDVGLALWWHFGVLGLEPLSSRANEECAECLSAGGGDWIVETVDSEDGSARWAVEVEPFKAWHAVRKAAAAN